MSTIRSVALAATLALSAPGLLAGSAGVAASAETVASVARSDGRFSTPLISRDVFFGNPDRASVQLSPDGKRISYLAPLNGVLNVFIGDPAEPLEATPITSDDDRGIRQYFWMPDSVHIVYLQDRGGDENWRAYSVNTKTGEERDLTPFENVAARIEHVSPEFPSELVVSINDRNPALHDVYRVDVASGERRMLYENPKFAGFVIDDSFDIRLGMEMTSSGDVEYVTIDEKTGATEPFESVPFADTQTTSIIGYNRDGSKLYSIDSRGRNTAALIETNTKTGRDRVVYSNPKADVSSAMVDPKTGEIEAVASNHLKTEWTTLDRDIKRDLDALRKVNPGEINVTSRTLDDDRWIVAFTDDNGPTTFYLYERDGRQATKLFTNRPALEGLPLAEMHTAVIEARDGLSLPSYFTLPVGTDPDGDGRPDEALPTVLFVHGGPWARDSWGFDPYHQWLANRGYAVLSVNFRSSTGFGKDFVNAGNGEWADAMHTDLLDAVNWAVEEGITDADKVGIMGGSYGGYAALAGLTYSPDFFACGVSIVGPSNLQTLLEAIPPYWEPVVEIFTRRVADNRTPEGRRQLRDMSPLTHVDEIKKPLLIGQGANDPRVKQQESDQIVQAMQRKNLPVTYVLFPDEGHGFAKPENRKAFNAVAEVFLAAHLDGRAEPVSAAIAESTAQILSMGDIDLPVEETPWEAAAAPETQADASGAIPEVAFEDLTEAQQAMASQAESQFGMIPPEMFPQVVAQLELQFARLPEDEKPVVAYLLGKLRERMPSDD